MYFPTVAPVGTFINIAAFWQHGQYFVFPLGLMLLSVLL